MADYTIVSGDTLSALAVRWDTTISEILKANPYVTDPNKIYIGRSLTIPGTSTPPDTSTGSELPDEPVGDGTPLLDYPSKGTAKNGVGGDPEVWKLDGSYVLVYYIPDTDPPIPYYYEATQAEIEGMYGVDSGGTLVVDREVTEAQLDSWGAIAWGDFDEIDPDVDDPFGSWSDTVVAQSAVRPWLREPDVLALIAEAAVEGRAPTEAEFQQTEWWQTHSATEREWMLLVESDPMTAAQTLQSNTILVNDLFASSGSLDAPISVIDYIAREFTEGRWSEEYANQQIKALTDPFAGIEVDEGLVGALGDTEIDTTQDQVEEVRTLVSRWLGPTFGSWDEAQIEEWAGKLRNDPDAEDALVSMLRGQRQALLPEYTNENLTYEDIAQPWRNYWTSVLGETPADESDSLFLDILRNNSTSYAQARLRQRGLRDGNSKIKQEFLTEMVAAGGGVRRAL
jgi:hypothetical protein